MSRSQKKVALLFSRLSCGAPCSTTWSTTCDATFCGTALHGATRGSELEPDRRNACLPRAMGCGGATSCTASPRPLAIACVFIAVLRTARSEPWAARVRLRRQILIVRGVAVSAKAPGAQ